MMPSNARNPGSVRPGGRELGAQLLLQARDADLEEFVEVVADDAQEAQPLEQRRRGILRQREDAAVERKLRQLAVDRRRRWLLHQRGQCRGGRHRNSAVWPMRMTHILQRGPSRARRPTVRPAFSATLWRAPIQPPPVACANASPIASWPSSISARTASGSRSVASRATRSTSSTPGARRCASVPASTSKGRLTRPAMTGRARLSRPLSRAALGTSSRGGARRRHEYVPRREERAGVRRAGRAHAGLADRRHQRSRGRPAHVLRRRARASAVDATAARDRHRRRVHRVHHRPRLRARAPRIARRSAASA